MRCGKLRRGFRDGGCRALTCSSLLLIRIRGLLLCLESLAFLIELRALLLRSAQCFIRSLPFCCLRGPPFRLEQFSILFDPIAFLLCTAQPFFRRQFLRLQLCLALGFIDGLLRLLGGLFLRCHLGGQSRLDSTLFGAVCVVPLVAPVARARDCQHRRGDRCQYSPSLSARGRYNGWRLH